MKLKEDHVENKTEFFSKKSVIGIEVLHLAYVIENINLSNKFL